MSRRAAAFTQADAARALRAAEQVAPGRYAVEIGRDGAITIRPAVGLSPLSPAAPAAAPVALKREPRL